MENNNNQSLIELLLPTTKTDRTIEGCIARYLQSVTAHSIDKRYSREQLGQLLTRPGHILLLQMHRKPIEYFFNEKDLDLFLMKHFAIHCLATDSLQRASVNITRIEAKAKSLLGLSKNFQGSIERNIGMLLELMVQESFDRQKGNASSQTKEGTYVPTLREYFAQACCQNQDTGEIKLAKQIRALGNEQKALSLLKQFNNDRQPYALTEAHPNTTLVKAQ